MKPYKITEQTTDQEIFDIVWNHFVTLKNPQSKLSCEDLRTRCLYRSPGGHGCAVGIFLPDVVAKKWDALPDTTLSSVIEQVGSKSKYVKIVKSHLDILCRLQQSHDQNGTTLGMECSLRNVARDLNLKVPQ